jgi:hypothetical protein
MPDNVNINLNPARQDRFSFALGEIPSLKLLTPEELTEFQKYQSANDDKNFFYLGIKSVELPAISLGDTKIDNRFIAIAETDMKYTFENFTTEIRLDNNYFIYKMLVLWMFLMNRPDEYNENSSRKTFEDTAVEGILTMKDNFNQPVISFQFIDLRPVALPSLPMTFAEGGNEIILNVTWQYTYFMPRKANGEAYNLDLNSI